MLPESGLICLGGGCPKPGAWSLGWDGRDQDSQGEVPSLSLPCLLRSSAGERDDRGMWWGWGPPGMRSPGERRPALRWKREGAPALGP